MSLKTKESVNRPCECGSGKKWKKCHGAAARTSPSLATPPDVAAAYAEMSKYEKTRFQRFGHARLPQVRTDSAGRTRVAVGDREFIGDHWRGVGDFLIPFVRKKLGSEWFDDQRRRPPEHQHIVMRWDAELRRLRDATPSEIGGGKNVRITASVFAYFMFAWDLVLIEENGGLPSSLLDRLRDRKRFQGARHEVFVSAVLTRANFRLDYEDESDSSGKHPEMIGVHRGSGQEVAIEAKSRHVHGVLDYRADSGRKGGFSVTSLLRKAFGKPTGGRPFVVFLDLNVPPSTYPLRDSGIGDRVKAAADNLTRRGPLPYNLVIVTNLALHYAEGSLVFPKKGNFVLEAKNPLVRPEHPAVLKELVRQAVDYGKFLPRGFEDLGLSQPLFVEQRRTR
jgi:hypothetical protein